MAGDPGRTYARIYTGLNRGAGNRFVEDAVRAAGGRVTASTGPSRAPLFLGIDDERQEACAICAYVFTATSGPIKNRPPDEHRFQVRYGGEASWTTEEHPIGFDPLGSDTTIVLGAHEEAGILIGADPLVYDPLPMGISIFFKEADVEASRRDGWHVWERDNIGGVRRPDPRSNLGLETLVGFRPERLLDYLRLERTARRLRLDPALRFRAAEDAGRGVEGDGLHLLEAQFGLSSEEILDIIEERPRLGMAVRGGVAERHLQKLLERDPLVSGIELGQVEGPPDLIASVAGHPGRVSVECKNASPRTYKGGIPKVETQKTRASKGDPKSRLYDPAQFDVLAACMFGPLRRWEFRFKRSIDLTPDSRHPDRIAPLQRIDESWSDSLAGALSR
jgi:hypothetical protein